MDGFFEVVEALLVLDGKGGDAADYAHGFGVGVVTCRKV